MRVLSDGARRLINEMKKLRLSLIFNEPGARERARSSRERADTMAVGPRGPNAPADHEISLPRVRAFTCRRIARLSRGGASEERPDCVFSRELGVFLRREKTAAGARADAPASLFALVRIVKYKRLANCVFRFHVEPAFGFVRNEYLIVSRCLTAEIFCTFNRMRQWTFLC